MKGKRIMAIAFYALLATACTPRFGAIRCIEITDTSPFKNGIPSEIKEAYKETSSDGYIIKVMSIIPRDKFGDLLGPGFSKEIKINVGNAQVVGPVADNNDGVYSQVIRYKKGADPTVTVTVSGHKEHIDAVKFECFYFECLSCD